MIIYNLKKKKIYTKIYMITVQGYLYYHDEKREKKKRG